MVGVDARNGRRNQPSRACDVQKSNRSKRLERETLHRSNEKELSHHWRERALLRSLMVKPCESLTSERPAVGWSAWLGIAYHRANMNVYDFSVHGHSQAHPDVKIALPVPNDFLGFAI